MERLEAQLGPAEGEPTVLGGGITNHNFRARFGGHEVVVRLPGNDTEHTRCPQCGATVIRRSGYRIVSRHLRDSACASCGTPIAGVEMA